MLSTITITDSNGKETRFVEKREYDKVCKEVRHLEDWFSREMEAKSLILTKYVGEKPHLTLIPTVEKQKLMVKNFNKKVRAHGKQ